MKFQRIPRSIVNTFLPSASANASQPYPRSVVPSKTLSKTPTKTIQAPLKAIASEKTRVNVEVVKKVETSSELVIKALNICAMEIGVDSSELADAIQFTDLGVDSLMSLTISGRFREELGLDVSSSLFTDCPTVGALKSHLLKQGVKETIYTLTERSVKTSEDIAVPALTPDSSTASPESSPTPQADDENGEGLIAIIRSTIAKEMGIEEEDIADTTDLSTIGMDSLMSLTILVSLREQTGLSIEPTLFADNPSAKEIKKALGLTKPKPPRFLNPEMPGLKKKLIKAATRLPSTTSVLLQGNTRTATKKLFLFPDGSGSATSYVTIPPIAPSDLCIYGLNCPFMTDPASFTIGIDGVTTQYLQEVLRRQPEGPYLLGGWSAGGVIAYECTRQLTAMARAHPEKNYEVEKLIMIDSPCPIRFEPLPSRLHHFFNNIGLLGTGNGVVPTWLLPHLSASIIALTAYKPERLLGSGKGALKALFIWAQDGVCKNPTDPRPPPPREGELDPKSMKWLFNNRTDFGANGWDELLEEANITCTSVGGNHFTIMREPIVSCLLSIYDMGFVVLVSDCSYTGAWPASCY